jgi:hypothetical protein
MNYRQYEGRELLGDLEQLVKHLLELAPWLDLGKHEELCRRSDHAFDAVISALLTRAAALGFTRPPSSDQLAAAVREGWIAMPTCSIDELI